MSQTETLLLIVLGFSLAALIALFIGRLMWSLAIRLGARRMQRQVPSTLAELHAERDRLRAEYAMLSQKLGARLEDAKARLAEQMAEVTRTRNRIDTLAAELAARESETAQRETNTRDLRAEITQLQSALADAQATIAAQDREIASRMDEIAALREGAARPLPAASLVAESAHAIDTETRLRQRIDKLTAMSQNIAEARAEAPDQSTDPTARLQQELEAAARETEDLQNELTRLDAAWTAKLGDPAQGGEDAAASGTPPAAPTRGLANVISLANRIRSLQKDIARS